MRTFYSEEGLASPFRDEFDVRLDIVKAVHSANSRQTTFFFNNSRANSLAFWRRKDLVRGIWFRIFFALRAITLSAAEILGVDDRIGSLTVGKDATLILCDGDILEIETHVTDAYIQGRKVDLGSRHTMLFDKYEKKYSRP